MLALTRFDEDELLCEVFRAGGSGFVLEDSPAEELIRAVRAVACGDSYLDPAATARVLTTYHQIADTRHAESAPELTARERDVLKLIAQGYSNTEIADELHISEVTVKSHIGYIFVKLALRDPAVAIVYAYDHGMVTSRYEH